MTIRLFRIAQIVFNRMQLSGAKTLNQGLKGDALWMSLSGKEHQMIGKIIAKYHTYFLMNCRVPTRVDYYYTDNNGNGIYHIITGKD